MPEKNHDYFQKLMQDTYERVQYLKRRYRETKLERKELQTVLIRQGRNVDTDEDMLNLKSNIEFIAFSLSYCDDVHRDIRRCVARMRAQTTSPASVHRFTSIPLSPQSRRTSEQKAGNWQIT